MEFPLLSEKLTQTLYRDALPQKLNYYLIVPCQTEKSHYKVQNVRAVTGATSVSANMCDEYLEIGHPINDVELTVTDSKEYSGRLTDENWV